MKFMYDFMKFLPHKCKSIDLCKFQPWNFQLEKKLVFRHLFNELTVRFRHVEFLCDVLDRLCAGMLCDRVRKRMACSRCAFWSEWWGSNSGWMLFHRLGIDAAFLLQEQNKEKKNNNKKKIIKIVIQRIYQWDFGIFGVW